MKRTIILRNAAFFITILAAYYERVTGPTYPLSGTAILAGETIRYRLNRSHDAFGADLPVQPLAGKLQYRIRLTTPGTIIRFPHPILLYLMIVFLFAGGVDLGPLEHHYAFGVFGSGWPIGIDLTDNKPA